MENSNQNSKKNFEETANNDKKIESNTIMKTEIEIVSDGTEKVVERARNLEHNPDNNNTTEPLNIDNASEKQVQKMLRNKDRNSDIATNRYPNTSPENKENRGNIELDQ